MKSTLIKFFMYDGDGKSRGSLNAIIEEKTDIDFKIIVAAAGDIPNNFVRREAPQLESNPVIAGVKAYNFAKQVAADYGYSIAINTIIE